MKRLSRFSKQLKSELESIETLSTIDSIVVGVSGGADSVALLLALCELVETERLNWRLIVGHLDHGLRAESHAEREWVTTLGSNLGLEVVSERVGSNLSENQLTPNLEEAARHARYEFLERAAVNAGAQNVLVAHTLDDQAETVIMRLVREAGGVAWRGWRPYGASTLKQA